ncbi:MAG TPA: PilN domain-containing protein [Gemmatimonadaceae bacterium]|nr:PilN domain-containing protein [Gemmatimonadaceae bacterium]
MSLVIGLAIEPDRLRAVGVRGARVLWGMDAPVTEATTLGDALSVFCAKLPHRRFGRSRVIVALGATFAQTKRLAGLPPIADERVLAKTVSEHAARFFLRNGVPLVTTSVRRDAAGQPWAAALQKNIVDTIVSTCSASRFDLGGIVPAIDVVKPDASALAPLGHEAMEFATAYGAAVTQGALAWRARATSEETAPRWRITTIAGACALALILALLATGLGARVAEHRAISHLASLANSTRAAQRAAHDNDLVTRALGEVATFDHGRRPITVLLSELAKTLPDSSALLAFHIDSTGGSVVALTPRAGALLTRLERVPELASPEITGPVTRETARGHDVDRVAVRFRWTHP